MLAICERPLRERQDDLRASSLGTLLHVVRRGLGVTLVPEIALSAEVGGDSGLVTRPLVDERAYRTVGLAWRKGSAREREYRLLGDFLALVARPQVAG